MRTPRRRVTARSRKPSPWAWRVLMLAVVALFILLVRTRYTVSLQWPVVIHFRWPVVIAAKMPSLGASEAQSDQWGRGLTAYQQYACNKFGPACRVALAIQRAENARGSCEVFHYNTDGTLDWGYFQINTVHLKRAGVNLRDLLDCKANIDFAYRLYQERGFQPWSTYNDGSYKRYLRD